MAVSRVCGGLWRTCRLLAPTHRPLVATACRARSSVSGELLPRTSLSQPPWAERVDPEPQEELRRQAAVVEAVQQRLVRGELGRLFAVVHFAGKQWKVTAEDLLLVAGRVEAECGERIRMEKVLLVGGEDFTLVGRPLLGRELVRVEATVIEKTQSWPQVRMYFWKRHRSRTSKTSVQPQTVLRINSIQVQPALC